MKSFVINLDRDTERLATFMHRFSELPQLKVVRVSGIYGKDLPRVARIRLANNEFWSNQRGEIGCFLSHVKTWEIIQNEQSACLVLEDDAVPNKLERLFSLILPDDADLIFVNSRMCPVDTEPDVIKFLPITDSMKLLNCTGEGVGTDGYILTPRGARKMLDAVGNDAFFGNVDWRMLRYSISPQALQGDLADTRCDDIIRNHHNVALPPRWAVVTAYCLNSPLIKLPERNNSTIQEANMV